MIRENILSRFKGRSCLVTGGTGLIGRQVVKILCDAEAEVVVASLDNFNVDQRAKHFILDLTNFEHCKKITMDMDYVFHLAGIKGSVEATKNKPADFLVPMLMMNANVLEACLINKVKKVVYTSSIGAYGNATVFRESEGLEGEPMDFVCWAKRMGELQIQAYYIQYGLRNFAIVRPCAVYGPGDNFDPDTAMVIPSLMAKIVMGDDPVVIWGDGSAIRDFAYSRDVAEGLILALHYGTRGHFVNLGSGRGYSIKELVETLNSFINFNYQFDTSKPSGFPKRIMDISLAKKLIRYSPTTTLLDGLKETWDWFVKRRCKEGEK